jgi:hypothetical protein
LAALAAAAAGAAHGAMDTASPVERGELFVPELRQARASSLGFANLLADYYWLQAVQIVGGEHRDVHAHAPVLARLIQLVSDLDPWVDHAYRFAAVWLTDSVESVERANALLERGIAYHPRDWRNRHYLGFNHFFYLGDDLTAAAALEGALGLPGAPRYLGALVAKLRLERDGLETAATFLAELARSTEDGYARAEYLKALDEVETERSARLLDAARAEYRRRHGRDIARVAELAAGPRALLRALPPAHPVHAGFEWELDEGGEIVSSFYGHRYEPHVHENDRERRESWKRQVEAKRDGGTEG